MRKSLSEPLPTRKKERRAPLTSGFPVRAAFPNFVGGDESLPVARLYGGARLHATPETGKKRLRGD